MMKSVSGCFQSFLDMNAQVLLMLSGEENPFVSLRREADIPLEVWTVDTPKEAA